MLIIVHINTLSTTARSALSEQRNSLRSFSTDFYGAYAIIYLFIQHRTSCMRYCCLLLVSILIQIRTHARTQFQKTNQIFMIHECARFPSMHLQKSASEWFRVSFTVYVCLCVLFVFISRSKSLALKIPSLYCFHFSHPMWGMRVCTLFFYSSF